MLSNPVYSKEWGAKPKFKVGEFVHIGRVTFGPRGGEKVRIDRVRRESSQRGEFYIYSVTFTDGKHSWVAESNLLSEAEFKKQRRRRERERRRRRPRHRRPWEENPVYPKEWQLPFKEGDRIRVKTKFIQLYGLSPEESKGVIQKRHKLEEPHQGFHFYTFLTDAGTTEYYREDRLELDYTSNPVYEKEWPEFKPGLRVIFEKPGHPWDGLKGRLGNLQSGNKLLVEFDKSPPGLMGTYSLIPKNFLRVIPEEDIQENPIYPKEWEYWKDSPFQKGDTVEVTSYGEYKGKRGVIRSRHDDGRFGVWMEPKPAFFHGRMESFSPHQLKLVKRGMESNPVYPKEWREGSRVLVYKTAVKPRAVYARRLLQRLLIESELIQRGKTYHISVERVHAQKAKDAIKIFKRARLGSSENPIYEKEWPDYGFIVRTGYDESDLIPAERVLDKYEIRHWHMTGVKSDLDNIPLITLHVQESDYLFAKSIINRAL